jgi:PDZ domain
MSFIISVPVLRMFLENYDKDQQATNFGSLPEVGFYCEELKNVSLRKKCFGNRFRDDNFFGCLVMAVNSFCPCTKVIRVGDVLLEVEGHRVSENGEVHFRNHEWLPWDWLISKKSFGENLKLKILRSDDTAMNKVVEQDVILPVERMEHLVPKILGVDLEPYWIIIGGLVFIKLSIPLILQLDKHGELLKKIAMSVVRVEEDEEIIILIDVLAHFINNSYRKYKWHRLVKLDGTSVRNMQHLALLMEKVLHPVDDCSAEIGDLSLEERSIQFIELDFEIRRNATERRLAVFDVAAIVESENEILEKHKIPSWCSIELLSKPDSQAQNMHNQKSPLQTEEDEQDG